MRALTFWSMTSLRKTSSSSGSSYSSGSSGSASMKFAEGPAYARLPSGPSPPPGLFTPLMSLWPDRKLVFKTFPPGARSLRPVNDALDAPGSSLGFADASTSVSRARLVGSCRTDACQSDPASVPRTDRLLQQKFRYQPNRLSVGDSKDKKCDRPLQTLERAACRNFFPRLERAA